MLKSLHGLSQALPVTQESFQRILSALWQAGGRRPRLGLAVSGGVDSMALASLCSKSASTSADGPSFTAFIVDHQLRSNSADEAEDVAKALVSLNIETQILKLDWGTLTQSRKALPNVESHARRLRYRAIGKACRGLGIESLLVAHHADDQAETILCRMIAGYGGVGLRGTKARSRIPECHGLYGVAESGLPFEPPVSQRYTAVQKPMMIESGGVFLHRPLLGFGKAQLISTCRANGVKWFEDPTNADRTLTPRNTVRHLLQSHRLPTALSVPAVLSMARRVEERIETREQVVEKLFNECNVQLDLSSGSLKLLILDHVGEKLSTGADFVDEARRRAALLTRRILLLITPHESLLLKDVQEAVELIFPSLFDTTKVSDTVSVAGLSISSQPSSKADSAEHIDLAPTPTTWTIIRQIPVQQHASSQIKPLLLPVESRASSIDPTWTPWHLFDNRYWLRLRYIPFNHTPHRTLSVRFLTTSDLPILRSSLSPTSKTEFNALLHRHAPGKTRFTLPAIVETRYVARADASAAGNGKIERVESVCALPSLGWGRKGWRPWTGRDERECSWCWEVRFRMVELGDDEGHVVCAAPVGVGREVRGERVRALAA